MPNLSIQVAASTDDCVVYYQSSTWVISLTQINLDPGDLTVFSMYKLGGGMCFQNVAIPVGSVITAAYITLTPDQNQSGNTVKTRITGDKELNAATFSTIANYQSRRGTVVGGANNNNITTAQVAWDSIAAWTTDNAINSPDISTIIQEIINQSGWASGNALALFWDDHDGRSSATTGGVAGTAPNLTSAVQGANIGATSGAPSVTGSSGLGAPAPTAVSGGNLPIDTATTGGGFNYTPGQATDTTIGGAGTVSGGATGGDVVSGTGTGAGGTGAGGTGVNLGTASDTGGGGGFNYNPTQATTGATTSPYSLATQGSTQGALGATTIGGETPASSTVGDFLGKAGSTILGQAEKNAIPLAIMGYSALNPPKLPTNLNSMSTNAQLAGTTGANLIDTSTQGIVTPGQQSNINMWTMQAKAQVLDYYSRQGLSGSSMEASALANVDMQASNQVQTIIQQNLTQGLTALGASNTGNSAVANATIANNTAVETMMANLAKATGSSAGQATNQTGTAQG